MLQAGAPGDNKSFMKRRAILFLLAAVAACAATTPVRRLNRYEYNCTVRDLLGVDFRPGPDFPADNFTYGFDNNADTLTVTPALLAKYLDAAKKIARAAAEPVPPPAAPELDRYSNASASPDLTWQRRFTWDGDYNARIALAGGSGPAAISVTLDEGEPRQLSVSVNFEGRRYADTRFNVAAGITGCALTLPAIIRSTSKCVAPTAWSSRPSPPATGWCSPAATRRAAHARACVRTNLENLARRAWRRPVTAAGDRPADGTGDGRAGHTEPSGFTAGDGNRHRGDSGVAFVSVSHGNSSLPDLRWPRGSRISSGAACPTANCCVRPRAAG